MQFNLRGGEQGRHVDLHARLRTARGPAAPSTPLGRGDRDLDVHVVAPSAIFSAWRRISSAVVGEHLERNRVGGDPLEQALGELLVVGQPGLPHQRRVGREARDPLIGGEGEDPVQIRAVREDLHVELPSIRSIYSARSPESGPTARQIGDAASGLTRALRLWALARCSISTVGSQPLARPGRRCRCRRSSTSAAGRCPAPGALEQHSRVRACGNRTDRRARDNAVRMVQADPEVVEPAPSAASSSSTRVWTSASCSGTPVPWPPRADCDTPTSSQPAGREPAQRGGRAGQITTLGDAQRRLRLAGLRIRRPAR